MPGIFIIFLLILTGCGPVHRKKSQLAKEMDTFLFSGKYDVQELQFNDSNKIVISTKGQLTLTNDLGVIEFTGIGSFLDLDSIKIGLSDSTLIRQFLVTHFIKTIEIPANKSGFNEAYFGYAFGEYESYDAPHIEESKPFASTENIAKNISIFIVGSTKRNEIVIKRLERYISLGEIIMDVNKIFILTRVNFS